MAIDFEGAARVRGDLVKSLLSWRANYSDGLWRSRIDKSTTSAPSFSTTGMVIQALLDAKRHSDAHHAANVVFRRLKARSVKAFVPLRGEASEKAHILNNAWATFAVLKCLPRELD